MEQIRQTLAIANALAKQKNPSAAYYKHLDAIHNTLDLLGAESFFRMDGISREQAGRLLAICDGALERACEELGDVLDLSEKEARDASQSSVLNAEPTLSPPQQQQPPAIPLVTPHTTPYEENTTGGNTDQADIPTKTVEVYGEEPSLGFRDDADLPIIPVSKIFQAICQHLLSIQLLYQRLEPLANSSPKQKGNALYLDAIRQILDRLKFHSSKKFDLEEGLGLARRMTVREIPAGDLARQVTLLQMDIYKRIPEGELSISAYERSSRAPNLSEFLRFSQYLTHWCQFEVLRYSQDNDRASVLGHLIRVANTLVELSNYEGAKALVTGLTAIPIHRLRSTNTLLPKRLRNTLESLSILLSERRGYAQLKEAFGKCEKPFIPAVVVGERWEEGKDSAYGELFPVQPIVQHYLLTQPFRWEEELFALSVFREPVRRTTTEGPSDDPMKITDEEVESLSYPQSDAYDIIRRQIQSPVERSIGAEDDTPRRSINIR